MAERSAIAAGNNIPTDSSEDDGLDDFILLPNSLIGAETKFSLESDEYGSRVDDAGAGTPKPHIFEPLEAFEMIQSEHRLLKDELTIQNRLLHLKLVAFEDNEKATAEKITTLENDLETSSAEATAFKSKFEASSVEVDTLKNQLNDLFADVTEKDTKQRDVEEQLNYFKERSEKLDAVSTKLSEAEDVIKSQAEIIQQLKTNDAANISTSAPIFSINKSLEAELKAKEEKIKRLEGGVSSLESAIGAMNGERLKARDEVQEMSQRNVDLQELVMSLQSQAEAEKAEWTALRVDLEQQIQILSDRVTAFERHYNGAPSIVQPDSSGAETLRHRDTLQHNFRHDGQAEPSRYTECPRCRLPMANYGPHPCPAVIDGLD